MADCVNPAMNTVQAFGLYARSSAALVDSGTLELGEGDNTMLIRRQTSDRSVRDAVVTFPHGGR
jgi:hypothetical protein